jgi:hypothetical protein
LVALEDAQRHRAKDPCYAHGESQITGRKDKQESREFARCNPRHGGMKGEQLCERVSCVKDRDRAEQALLLSPGEKGLSRQNGFA